MAPSTGQISQSRGLRSENLKDSPIVTSTSLFDITTNQDAGTMGSHAALGARSSHVQYHWNWL
jgi:3-deoxy-D-arabino-heptulosonate 7-phosphate (DAHP) synthase